MKSIDDYPVLVNFSGERLAGEIWFSSYDRLSLVIKLNGKCEPEQCLMLLLWIDNAYVDILTGCPVKIQAVRDVKVVLETTRLPQIPTKTLT